MWGLFCFVVESGLTWKTFICYSNGGRLTIRDDKLLCGEGGWGEFLGVHCLWMLAVDMEEINPINSN